MLSIQRRKNIRVEDNKKRMSIDIYIMRMSIYIYVPVICDKLTQNKNDLINSIRQYGRVVDKNCCVVFPASGLPYLILCPRQCKDKVATTYLVIRTKNN